MTQQEKNQKLISAIYSGYLEKVKEMLEARADVNARCIQTQDT